MLPSPRSGKWYYSDNIPPQQQNTMCYLHADFDYETPAIGLLNRNKVYLDLLLPMHYPITTIRGFAPPADKSQRNKEKRRRT